MAARFRWTLTNLSDNSFEVLSGDPYGFEEVVLTLTRDPLYKGMFVDFTASLGWHCNGGGREFIANIFQLEDVNAVIVVTIEINCDANGENYQTLYTGRLDLASKVDDGEVLRCTIERSDLYSKLKSRDEISVDISSTVSIGEDTITNVETFDMPLTSMEVLFKSNWYIENGYIFQIIRTVEKESNVSGFEAAAFVTHDMLLLNSDFEESYPCTEFENYGQFGPYQAFEELMIPEIMYLNDPLIAYPQEIVVKVDFEGTFTDEMTIVGQARVNRYFRLGIFWGEKGTNNYFVEYIYTNEGYNVDPFTTNFSIHETRTLLQVNRKDSIWIAWVIHNEANVSSWWTNSLTWQYTSGTVEITAQSLFYESSAKVLMVHEALNQVADSIADKDGSLYSEFYGRTDSDKVVYASDGCGSHLALTNGLNIRQFPNKPIYFTLKEFFQSLEAIHNIGLTIEGDVIRIEGYDFFFDNSSPSATFDRPVSVKRTIDTGYYFNKINIGYDKWETEFKGGLDEPNSTREYSTKVNASKGTYTKLSKYVASPYALELTRRKNINFLQTEDWRYDNDNFFIAAKRGDGAYMSFFYPELYADSFTNGGNMESLTSAYNLRLSPARMLLAHFKPIAACLQVIKGLIKFVKGTGNFLLYTAKDNIGCQEDYSGVDLYENQSFNYNDSDALNVLPLWLPERYEFNYPITFAQYVAITTNPHKYIQLIDDKGNLLKGFVLSMKYNLKTGITEFNLLRMFE